ncbi:hypothetical protein D3C71_2049200 [compost metagenome]
MLISLSAVFTWSAVTPSASKRSGSSETRTSRLTPPRRCTFCTPGSVSNSLVIVSSTNQDSSTSDMWGARTA